MIHLLLGVASALVVVLLFKLVLGMSLWIALPMGIIAGVGLFIYMGRRMQGQMDGIFNRAGEQLKKQQYDRAIEIMKEGYRFSAWQFMVKGSIDGQIGVIQYVRKKNDEAEPLLRSASMNHYVAKAMLGILQWKRGEKAEAKKTFERAMKAGKKESLMYAVYAYVLMEMKDRDGAMKVLSDGLGICKGDDRLKTNLTLVQNNKPMKMKVFGEQWYQFLLERPIVHQEPPPFARVSKRAIRG